MEQEIFNVARFLELTAKTSPTKTAVKVPLSRDDNGAIIYQERTFEELNKEADATAYFLQERGICRGMRVLLMVRPGLDLILITFALFKLGAIPVIIDPGMGLKHFLKCVKQSKPSALIGIPLAQWISQLFFPFFQSVKFRIIVNKRFLTNIEPFKSEKPFELARTKKDELAAILFTSGSTGAPKGVCYLHGHFEAQVRLIGGFYKFEADEVDLPMLPVFALFNPAFGMTTVVPEMNPSRPATVDPKKIVQAILQCGVTNSFGSPVLWGKICSYCEENKIRLPSIKRILMAGAPVSIDLFKRMKAIIPNGEIFSPYGATECLPIASISASEAIQMDNILHEKGHLLNICVGKPLDGIDVAIISDKHKNDDACLQFNGVGVIGEIIVRGAVVTEYYDNLPEATVAAKIKDDNGIWHRMGDLGFLDHAGRLWFCGRKAEQIEVLGADNQITTYHTSYCESIFNKHPKVYRSALITYVSRRSGRKFPAIVIESKIHCAPRNESEKKLFIKELRLLALNHYDLSAIYHFFFLKKLPVDVRHNAKIHRLTLGRYFSKKF